MKKIYTVLVIMVMVGAMMGCSSPTDENAVENTLAVTEAGGGASSKIRVVAAVKKLSSSFWVDMETGIKERCAEYGWDVEVLCPVNETNEEQIQLLEQSLLNPPDIYLITPIDSQGIIPVIEKINEAGIPIINFNTLLGEGAEYETFVGVEYTALAKTCAEAIAEKAGYKGNIIMIEGTTGSQTAIDMKAGAEEVFTKYPDMKILDSQPANYLRAEALTVTQNLLQKHSDVQIIFACNGEMALGAAEAVRQANRSDIMIATLNMSDEVAQAIGNETITLTVDDDSTNVGKQAVSAAKRVLDGETLERFSYQEGIVVDSDTLAPYKEKYGF